jgi:hypothetical protein
MLSPFGYKTATAGCVVNLASWKTYRQMRGSLTGELLSARFTQLHPNFVQL